MLNLNLVEVVSVPPADNRDSVRNPPGSVSSPPGTSRRLVDNHWMSDPPTAPVDSTPWLKPRLLSRTCRSSVGGDPSDGTRRADSSKMRGAAALLVSRATSMVIARIVRSRKKSGIRLTCGNIPLPQVSGAAAIGRSHAGSTACAAHRRHMPLPPGPPRARATPARVGRAHAAPRWVGMESTAPAPPNQVAAGGGQGQGFDSMAIPAATDAGIIRPSQVVAKGDIQCRHAFSLRPAGQCPF